MNKNFHNVRWVFWLTSFKIIKLTAGQASYEHWSFSYKEQRHLDMRSFEKFNVYKKKSLACILHYLCKDIENNNLKNMLWIFLRVLLQIFVNNCKYSVCTAVFSCISWKHWSAMPLSKTSFF